MRALKAVNEVSMARKSWTTEQLGRKVARDIRKMPPEQKAEVRWHLEQQFKQNDSDKKRNQQRIQGLAESARKIAREGQTEELSNYFEVLRFFQNPPDLTSASKN